MNTVTRLSASLAVAASLTAVAVAQAPALDVKMGLWELSTVSELSGQMPGIDTSKMTPEQKAKMDEAMKAMMGKHTNVNNTCMTQEKFNKSNFMAGDKPEQNCKQTITTNTRSTLEGTLVCTGENAMTAQMHIDALSSTAIKATFKSASSQQGKTMMMNMEMAGKWLSADCGKEK